MRSDRPLTRRAARPLGIAVLITASVLAAGCVTPSPSAPSNEVVALERRARVAEERGDVAAAMQLYRQLAEMSRGTLRAGYLLDAARLAVDTGDAALASEWLSDAEQSADAPQRQVIVVLRAELDLLAARAANALARLNQLQQPLAIPLMTEAESVRGRALFQLGRAAEAVRTLVEREAWLETSDAILDNHRMIWDGLAASVPAATRPTGDMLVDGWLALAPIAAAGVSGAELRGALVDWRREYAGHPAAAGLLADLLASDRAEGAYPGQIALLLPISSQVSTATISVRDAAIAVRDGFLAAHLARASAAAGNAGDDVSIRVYDTNTLGAAEAYQRAQLEGAEFIVGPLLRPEVESVITQAGGVPTLALNNSASESPAGNFWQFALAPEDETRAIARRAFADGARTALALVPRNADGTRLLNSFREEFELLGGRVVAYNTYDTSARDFSIPVQTLLNLDRSQQRRTRLANDLGTSLGFEPRRRQDADMLFLAATNRGLARQLAPALRVNLAADIPTYAMSDIYEPSDTARDNDLNNIYFPDAPWLIDPDPRAEELKRTLQSYWPRRATAGNLRFYGMGVDAYRLIGAFYAEAGAWPVAGLSGQLEVDFAGRVRRALPLAQFRNGRPVALEPSPLERRPPSAVPELEPLREFVGAR